jgi:hypothetical protein
MGRQVTCDGEFVWKYVLGEQSSELYRVPEETGLGEHHFIRFNPEALEDGIYDWERVNPENEEFEAEVLILAAKEIEALSDYVNEHTHVEPEKLSFFQKLLGKTSEPEQDHFISMLSAFIEYGQGRDEIELIGEL